MKPGDLLYTVYEDDWGKPLSIKTAEIVSMGLILIKIRAVNGERTGLAFNCRSQISHKEAEGYGLSAREAWEKYAYRTGRAIDAAERELVRLQEHYRQAIVEARV